MDNNTIQQTYLEALIKGNRLECHHISSNLLKNNISGKDFYENIIKKSLYEIGEMWEMGKNSVAIEHLASTIVESNLNEQYPQKADPLIEK